jgi:hypothetical protein
MHAGTPGSVHELVTKVLHAQIRDLILLHPQIAQLRYSSVSRLYDQALARD